MAGMELDAPPEPNVATLNPRERILQRLLQLGIPRGLLDESQPGLISFVKQHKLMLPQLVSVILPTDTDVADAQGLGKQESGGGSWNISVGDLFAESLLWLQWLMFEEEPQTFLSSLSQNAVGQRAVCGAVWGQRDLAYRCRTCEHDPTCAICVPCFQNGNHKDHDYSIMYTGGGCCDCGDVTAWKRDGFCSRHKGAEQIQPLPEEVANSASPVLDALLICWRDKLLAASDSFPGHLREGNNSSMRGKYANELSSMVVQMLLEFCNCSESLLSFVSSAFLNSVGLLDILVRAEVFLDKLIVKKLHELLLKLLGEPLFKYEFAKVFIKYYPSMVNKIIHENNDTILERYPLLSTFSVQIFTVPTLTPRLVRELNLLGVLLECMWNLFESCVGADGHLEANKCSNIYESTIRLVEDTRYVVSHAEVPKYVVRERPDITRHWIQILGQVHGIDPQKRVTSLHLEEENENLHVPFVLGHYLGNVQGLLVNGAFSLDGREENKSSSFSTDVYDVDDDILRHAKIGRISQETSVSMCQMSRTSAVSPEINFAESYPCITSYVISLIVCCIKALDDLLASEIAFRTSSSHDVNNSSDHIIMDLRTKLFGLRRHRGGANICRYSIPNKQLWKLPSSSSYQTNGINSSCDYLTLQVAMKNIDNDGSCMIAAPDDHLAGNLGTVSDTLNLLSISDWPEIVYDVSSQEISFHIPLHRLLSLLLRKTMRKCYGEDGAVETRNYDKKTLPSGDCHDFFKLVLRSFHPSGFSAFMMEHPLRLRVFCAQVHAGMWRKNGDAGILISDWYRSVRWFDIGVESDLFLLQCCAALAPAESFVKRILERFGLLNYLSLDVTEHSEYEPILVQEMLSLLIQIVADRRFCGLSTSENLCRELVYRLATGDATRSQLIKALPRDLSKDDQVQGVIDMVAVYTNPSGLKQGKYSLRTTYWKELDLYHPRWTSRELQGAEERYLRFCKASALNVQLPRWTKIFDPLRTLCRIPTSKMILQIVRAVLFYAVFTDLSSVSRAPEGVIVTALHLLSLALDVCDKYITGGDPDGSLLHSVNYGDDMFSILRYASEVINGGAGGVHVVPENQSLLSLLVLLMGKYKSENEDNHGDSRLCNISSLVERLLKKFAQLDTNCMDELKRLAPHIASNAQGQKSVNNNLHNLVSVSDIERKAKAREHQAAVLEKMRAEQSKFMASLKSSDSCNVDVLKSERDPSKDRCIQEESTPICSLCRDTESGSPLSFLVLLQKSRLSNFIDRRPPSWDDMDECENQHLSVLKGNLTSSSVDLSSPELDLSSHLLQLLQGVGHELLHDLQPTEIIAFLDATREDVASSQLLNLNNDTEPNMTYSLVAMENEVYQSVQEDILDSMKVSDILAEAIKNLTSFASEGLGGGRDRESVVVGEYIVSELSGTSRMVAGPSHSPYTSSKSASSSTDFERFGPISCDGIHISSCGHAVHQECHGRYLFSLKQRHVRRLGFEGVHIVDPDSGELLCPVCRRFANSILPMTPTRIGQENVLKSDGSFASACGLPLSQRLDNNISHVSHAIALLSSTAGKVGQSSFFKMLSGNLSGAVEPALEPIIRKLCAFYFPNGYERLLPLGQQCCSLLLWDTLRYSLISTEIAARGKTATSSDGSHSGLHALYGELQSSNGFILSLLLQVAQASRSLNHLQVLMRFSRIELLAASICSGFPGNKSNADTQKGSLASIVEYFCKEEITEIKFLKQAADPVLAHDPFSSLLWVLFALPLPFMASSESFIALVHLFYVVCVIQALITCHCKRQYDISCIVDCPVSDICKAMGESELAQRFFMANHFYASVGPKDTIRRFTFPYLRRCALLRKMLESSISVPRYDAAHVWDKLTPYLNNNLFDNTDNLMIELREISELETTFQLHSLDAVLKDKLVHALALKWCAHFSEEFSVRNFCCVLYSTPAVPFRLMRLPLLYQDLLQRYIKQQCPECKVVPEDPALCLLCGRLCSPSWKPCCRAGKCQSHAAVCGAGIGVFLLIRRTTILLQRSSRQAPWPSPYLDAFGEEDHDIYRGKPLYLSDDRYSALAYLVASHGFDRSSEVLRQTTINLNGLD